MATQEIYADLLETLNMLKSPNFCFWDDSSFYFSDHFKYHGQKTLIMIHIIYKKGSFSIHVHTNSILLSFQDLDH